MWMEKNAQRDESSEEDEDRDDEEVYHNDEEIELDEDGEESINEAKSSWCLSQLQCHPLCSYSQRCGDVETTTCCWKRR